MKNRVLYPRSATGAAAILLALLMVTPAGAQSDSIPAEGGEIRITPITHASVQVEFGGRVIYVDPSQGEYAG